MKDLNYYLNLHWTYRFEWSEEDNCYIASIAEIEGLKTDCKNIQQAAYMIQDALKSYISCMLEHNGKIPEPAKPERYKGKITYRTSPKIHHKLALMSKIQKKSISKLIDELIDKEL
jgi:predicted RNase H-like HicB family nuclease